VHLRVDAAGRAVGFPPREAAQDFPCGPLVGLLRSRATRREETASGFASSCAGSRENAPKQASQRATVAITWRGWGNVIALSKCRYSQEGVRPVPEVICKFSH
jgi:hypothetical protein